MTLDGSKSSPSSLTGAAAADENNRDAPTFRFQWSVVHYPLDPDAHGVEAVLAGLDDPLPFFTGDEGKNGIHETFVTSQVYSGNLGGIDGADAICQTHALDAGFVRPSEFKAMICDGSGLPPYERLGISEAVYATGAVMGGSSSADLIGQSFKVRGLLTPRRLSPVFFRWTD